MKYNLTSLHWLLLWASCLWGAERTDVTSLVQKGSIRLLSGAAVQFESPLKGATVIFKDLHPGANWSHPAEFHVLSPEGKILERQAVRFPPAAWEKTRPYTFLDADPHVPFNMTDHGGTHYAKNPDNHYAVLINGRAEKRHWNDFAFLYYTLTHVYRFHKDHIFVADSEHQNTLSDLNMDGQADIHYGSSIGEIDRLFKKLEKTLDEHSQVLIVVNAHGAVDGGESTLILMDGELRANQFASRLRKLPAKNIIAVFEQCFSGGFVRPAVDKRTVAMAASTDREFSWASMDLRFNEFLYLFTAALAGQTHKGRPLSADVNGNGKISMQEAFGYALTTDRRRESPLLESSPNSGLAAKLSLSQ